MNVKEYLIDNLGFIIVYLILIIIISVSVGKKAVVSLLGLTLFIMILNNINIIYPATRRMTNIGG